MIIIGLILGWEMSIITIFLSAFLALPISLVILKIKKNHELPYGPFLAFASLIIYFTHIDISTIFEFLNFLTIVIQ